MTDNYKTIMDTNGIDPLWDSWLSGLECAHYEQSTCWAEVKQHQGWIPVRIKIFKGTEWMAGSQMLCKKLPLGGLIGYIPSGPFYKEPDDRSLDVLLDVINRLAEERNIQYIAITPHGENAYLDNSLVEHGYKPTMEKLPPKATARATLLVDLAKDLDALLIDMRQKTRQQIRIALKSGLTIRDGDKKDLHTLFRLMAIVADKNGGKPVPGNVEIFNAIWDSFHLKGYVKLLVLELNEEPVAAGLIFTFGNTVRFWKIGWSGAEIKKHPTQLLYWELIKWSKNNGFRYFDIVNVDALVADHLLSGLPPTEALKARQLYGVTHFKLGFGGTVAKFSGPWFRFQNPLIRHIYDHYGSRLMEMPYTNKVISRIS